MDNIIDFESEKKKIKREVNDKDINALFMGLLKIVKKSAYESVCKEIKEDCKEANENFREALIELQNLKITYNKLLREKEFLEQKVDIQRKQICLLISSKKQHKPNII